MTLFQEKRGYGKGCPWSCRFGRDVKYNVEDYPEANRAIESIIGIAGIKPPNGLELMKYYVEAFDKVFDNLDQVIG